MNRGKKYTEVAKLVDRDNRYSIAEASTLIKKTARAKFDETVEMHIRLGVDPKKSQDPGPYKKR